MWAYGSACRVWRSIFVICFLLVSFFSFLSSSHPIPFLQPAFQFSTIPRSWWTLSFQSHLFPSKLPYVPGLPVPIGPPRWGNSSVLLSSGTLVFLISPLIHKTLSVTLVQIHSKFSTMCMVARYKRPLFAFSEPMSIYNKNMKTCPAIGNSLSLGHLTTLGAACLPHRRACTNHRFLPNCITAFRQTKPRPRCVSSLPRIE